MTLVVTDLALAAADFAQILRAVKFLQPGDKMVIFLGGEGGGKIRVANFLGGKIVGNEMAMKEPTR